VLDDTDKWASTEERLRAGRRFFDESLAALVELALPVIANAHPRYFDTTGIPAHIDSHVQLPRIPHEAVERILTRRVTVATEDSATARDVFDADALAYISHVYVAENTSIRRVIQISSEALVEADEAGLSRITIGAIENALAALR
jgi:Cdc6-like AAA superfamily ATPase